MRGGRIIEHAPIGLAHIGIPCADLSSCLEFYGKLGFGLIVRRDDLEGFNVAMMDNHGCVIELYESLANAGQDHFPHGDGAVNHIALACNNIKATYDECVRNGYAILSDGIEATGIWAPRSCRYFIVEGPCGERIELNEIR